MRGQRQLISIVMAEDDPDDRLLARQALEESRLVNRMDYVEDGFELLDYLHRRERYASRQAEPLPGLILLDLNMPRMDGRRALEEIKAHARLRRIPVVVLTTSGTDEDIIRSYDLGVNSFIVKPVTFESMVEVVRTLGKYWFEIVELPPMSKDH
jgi:CheY-like chemotaxis protein